MHNDYDAHIDQIRQLYKEQAQAMTEAMDRYFPETVRYTLSLIHIFYCPGFSIHYGDSPFCAGGKSYDRRWNIPPSGGFLQQYYR